MDNLTNENQNNTNVYTIVIAVLLLLAASIGFFFWQKSRKYLDENERIKMEMSVLESEKASIQASLDSLSLAYSELRTENESLQGRVNTTAQLVQQKEAAIRKIKASTAKDLAALSAQVDELKKTKIELETIVSALRTENETLRAENTRLSEENSQLKGDNSQLNNKVQDLAKQLEDQIRKTQSATFKASSFSVQLERKDKPTYKAKRARQMYVSFDLADVPEPYQQLQKLYMVITDDKGTPVPAVNPVKATINAPAGKVEIVAQQVKTVVLEQTQRLSFTYKLDDKLAAGSYLVAIYCDKGLLGAATFKLI